MIPGVWDGTFVFLVSYYIWYIVVYVFFINLIFQSFYVFPISHRIT